MCALPDEAKRPKRIAINHLNNKDMKMHYRDLSLRDWKKLISYNIVDSVGNGFANTTKEFDSKFNVSRSPKYVRVKSTMYEVAYVSGCFYPIWAVVSAISNFEPYNYSEVEIIDGELCVTDKTMTSK